MSDKLRILIVEDDSSINDLINETLTKSGYECVQAFSGTEGLMVFKLDKFDIVLMDLMMPGMSGEDLTKKIREISQVPIIIISAKSGLSSKVDLLSSGADDFLAKPFDITELKARVAVQLRHNAKSLTNVNNSINGDSRASVLTFGDISLDKDSFEVSVNGENILLTRQEYRILELFMLHPTKVFSKQEIFEYAWEEYYIGEDKTINVHISNIRGKIKKVSDKKYIDTIWGIGYRLSKS